MPTVGPIYGLFAGAESPREWLERLFERDRLERLGRDLYSLSKEIA